MKKIIAVLLALVLALGIGSAFAEAAETDETVRVYTYTVPGMMGDELLEIVLKDDGTVQFSLPEHEMITDVYEGTYEQIGNIVIIKGLRNVDETSDYTIPGLWPFINTVTGDAVIEIDDETGLYVPYEGDVPTTEAQVYTYTVPGMMGDETLEFVLMADGTVQFSLPDHEMITEVYMGTYTRDENTVEIKGLRCTDESSDFQIPGLWPFINTVTGDATIIVDDATGTYTPAN